MSQNSREQTVGDNPAVPTAFVTDSGTAIPQLNTLNILGGTGLTTTASGNSVTIDFDGSSGVTSITGTAPISASPSSGAVTISLATPVSPTYGGTGISSYTLGDTLYSSAANTLARLPGNTTSDLKVLAQIGDGTNSAAPQWVPLPITGSTIFMFSGLASNISTYYQMPVLALYTPGALTSVSASVNNTPVLLASFATNANFPNVTVIPTGLFTVHYETSKNSGNNGYYTYAEIYKRTTGGVETLLLTSDNSAVITDNTIQQITITAYNSNNISLNQTDRLVVKIYAVVTSSTHTITLYWDDNTDARLQLPASSSSTYIIGTANQIIASAPIGTVTLSTPQDIAPTSTVTFGNITSTGTLTAGASGFNVNASGTITAGTWGASTIAVNRGGTGQTTYTDGQLLIGNSAGNTLTKATLTAAGTGVSIINGNGSISIANTGVTSIAANAPLSVSASTGLVSLSLSTPLASIYGGTGVNNGTSTITIGGNFSMLGAFFFAGTLLGNTAVTFPQSGTLATTGSTIPSITGTANEVIVNGTVGTPVTGTAITLTLPQDIDTAATVRFAKLGLGVAASNNQLSINGKASVGYSDTSAPTNGLIVAGQTAIGASSPYSGAFVSVATPSSTQYGIQIGGTLSSITLLEAPKATQTLYSSIYSTSSTTPNSGTNPLVASHYAAPTFTLSSNLSGSLYGFYHSPTVATTASNFVLTNAYGIYTAAGSLTGGGSVTNAYGGYFVNPGFGSTVKCALYADNQTIGYNATPPTNGLIVSGNVGIGTNSPGFPLVIASTATTGIADLLSIENNNTIGSTSKGSRLYFRTRDALNATQPQAYLRAATESTSSIDSSLFFAIGATGAPSETLRIASNGGICVGNSYINTTPPSSGAIIAGNVGIGNNNPGVALDIIRSGVGVTGEIKLLAGTLGSGSLANVARLRLSIIGGGGGEVSQNIESFYSSGISDFGIQANINNFFQLTRNGPGSNLILSSTGGGLNNETLQFRTSYALAANPFIASVIGAPSNTGGRLIFSTAQGGTGTMTERIRIDENGFVGIGVASGYPLQIGGTSQNNLVYITGTASTTVNSVNNVGFFNAPTISTTAAGTVSYAFLNSPTASASGSGTYTNYYHAYFGGNITATTTNSYNLYVDNLNGGTNRYTAIFGSNSTNLRVGIGTSTPTAPFQVRPGSGGMSIDANGNIINDSGTLGTGATNGFIFLSNCAGVPTGVPANTTGRGMIYDTTNNRLYIYNGGWKYVALI